MKKTVNMRTVLLSLILIHYTNFILSVEAEVPDFFLNGPQVMFESTKDSVEWAQEAFHSYRTELNKIVSRKTPDEIVNEINSRVSNRVLDCNTEDVSCKRTWLFGKLSSHTVIIMTIINLRTGAYQLASIQTELGSKWEITLDLIDIGLEKLSRTNTDLRNISSNFDKKAEQLKKLSFGLDNAVDEHLKKYKNDGQLKFELIKQIEAVNETHAELKSMFEKECYKIKSDQMILEAEAKTVIDLISKIKEIKPYLRKQIGNVESLANELADTYEIFLKAHGIPFEQNQAESILHQYLRKDVSSFFKLLRSL